MMPRAPGGPSGTFWPGTPSALQEAQHPNTVFYQMDDGTTDIASEGEEDSTMGVVHHNEPPERLPAEPPLARPAERRVVKWPSLDPRAIARDQRRVQKKQDRKAEELAAQAKARPLAKEERDRAQASSAASSSSATAGSHAGNSSRRAPPEPKFPPLRPPRRPTEAIASITSTSSSTMPSDRQGPSTTHSRRSFSPTPPDRNVR